MPADARPPEPALTLAGLRRRGAPRRPAPAQPDLFSLFDTAPEPGPPSPDSPLSAIPSPQHAPELPPAPASSQSSEFVPAPQPASVTLDAGPPPLPAPDPEPAAAPQTWTVSGLVRHVRGLVEQGYGTVTVEGEVSNWRPASSGHCYFTVKDAGAQLTAVMFRRQVSLLRFRPADGDAVRLHGQLSIYESRGQMQLIVEWMQQVGLGALLAEVQRLKERLRQEGLFDRKRPLPPFPRCIGVITSLHGAALRDIVKVCRRRHAAVRLLIYPAAVQGPNCPAEIAAGLRWFNAHPDQAEVLLVARGGGSWEDLHGFDHESVARAIAASTLPVITGIGHAPDSTVADAAADLCAPTPSAAAELLTAAQHRVEEHMARLHSRLLRSASFEILRAQQRLARLGTAASLRRVEAGLNRRAQRLDELSFRTEQALRLSLRGASQRLATTAARLQRHDPTRRVEETRRRLAALDSRLRQLGQARAGTASRSLDRCTTRLEAMSPLRVLERGYALVYDGQGHLVRSPSQVAPGQVIAARLSTGELRATVLPSAEPSMLPAAPTGKL